MTTLALRPPNDEECSLSNLIRDRYHREDTARAGDALLQRQRRNPRSVVVVKSVPKEKSSLLIMQIDEMDNRFHGLEFGEPWRIRESLRQM